jgi:hypothetical protein
MALGCRLPSGTVVNTEDLPLEVWEDTAVNAGLPIREWVNVAVAPGAYPRAAVALIRACAAHVGEPEPPAGYLKLGNLGEVFAQVSDDLPTEYTDGMPVDPKDPPTDS